jgi:histidyl-tRNA synthetase
MLTRTPTSGEWDPRRGAAASALGLASPAIDIVALKTLSNRASSPQETPASLGAALVDLAPVESHATAAVLLNKLLLRARHRRHGHAPRRVARPRRGAATRSRNEAAVVAASTPVAVALVALIDCVADVVAALPARTRGEAGAFDVPASGNGLSAKDEADAAADIKMLVFGSKLVGSAGV